MGERITRTNAAEAASSMARFNPAFCLTRYPVSAFVALALALMFLTLRSSIAITGGSPIRAVFGWCGAVRRFTALLWVQEPFSLKGEASRAVWSLRE